MPNTVLCMLTYNRPEYARMTLGSILGNIESTDRIHVHIGDDGTGGDYLAQLEDFACQFDIVESVSVSDSHRGGYGANFNQASQIVHNVENVKYVLQTEDDWELRRRLSLDTLKAQLDAGLFGCIRLGYLGYTKQISGQVIATPDGISWLLLSPDSEESFIFTGHPRFETIEWEKTIGPWPEGLLPGETEIALTPVARHGIVWPMEYVKPTGDCFAHIGAVQSY